MKELVIISGKGGTGKTSFASAFSSLGGEKVTVADCDVDAADMHILLDPQVKKTENFYSGYYADIDQEKCNLCMKCIEICKFDAISKTNKQLKVDEINCEGCGYCFEICPSNSIKLQKNHTGKIISSVSRFGNKFVYGKLNTGAENSGRLVAEVKNRARVFAKVEDEQLIIVDGSPGIGCPVISSIAGANLVLLVTEPTVSGIHDLRRISEVIEKFKIPAICIINKSDLNSDNTRKIKDFLDAKNINLVGEIKYSEIFPMAISDGKTIIEFSEELKTEVEKIWELIKQKIEEC
ncbi:MAG: ATP-binding protein [Rhodothermaceae bacterium]